MVDMHTTAVTDIEATGAAAASTATLATLDTGHAVVMEGWAVMRHGLTALLAGAGIATEASTATAIDGFTALRSSDAGLVVLGSVTDATQREAVARAVEAGRRVIVVVTPVEQGDVVELFRAGALAVVPRGTGERELAAAVEHVLRGEAYVASALVEGLFTRPEANGRFRSNPMTLTAREQSVLELLAAGRTNREIAHELCIGTETVKTHLGNIYAKLDVRKRQSAVRVAIHHGLI